MRSCTTPPAASLSNLEFDTRSFFVFCLFSSFHFLMLQQEERFSTAENPTLWKTSTAHRINAKATLPRSRQCTNSKCHQAFGRFFPLTASSVYRIISSTCCPARHPHTRKAKRQRNATIYRTTSSACCPARRPHARKASASDYIEHQHMKIISLWREKVNLELESGIAGACICEA